MKQEIKTQSSIRETFYHVANSNNGLTIIESGEQLCQKVSGSLASFSNYEAAANWYKTKTGKFPNEKQPLPSSTVERTGGQQYHLYRSNDDTLIYLREDKTFRIIAEVPNDEPGREDAAYICKAVNLHEELVEVLEDTWKWIRNNFDRADEPNFFENLKAALQKAKG